MEEKLNNMNIDIKDLITLDDKNKYVVASKANYENRIYYLLVNLNDMSDVKFCYEKGIDNTLLESDDKEINQKLLPLFLNATDKAMNIDLSKLDKEN